MLANDEWGDQVGEGKSICLRLILFYVLVRRKKVQEQQKQWKGKLEDIDMYSPYQDAVGIGGEAIELEWKNSKIFSRLSILQEIQKDLIQKSIQPKEPNDLRVNVQTTSCGNQMNRNCISNAEKVNDHAKQFLPETLDVSWSRLRDDIGTEVLTNNNSKKQDTLFFTDISA